MINTSIHFPSSWLAGDQQKWSDVLTGGRWPEQTWHGVHRIPPQKEKHILISFYRYVARYWVVFTLAFWNSEVSSGMSLVFRLACRVFRTPDWEVLKERFSEVPSTLKLHGFLVLVNARCHKTHLIIYLLLRACFRQLEQMFGFKEQKCWFWKVLAWWYQSDASSLSFSISTLDRLAGLWVWTITFHREREAEKETDSANFFVHTAPNFERVTWGFRSWIRTPGILGTGPAPPGPSIPRRKRSPISWLAAGWALCFWGEQRFKKWSMPGKNLCPVPSNNSNRFCWHMAKGNVSNLSDRFYKTCTKSGCRLLLNISQQ